MKRTNAPRHWLTAVAALALTVAAVFVGPVAAQAASGSGYIYRAPGGSYGYYQFNNVNTTTTSYRVMSQPAAGATLGSGKCYDLWLDHTNATGNHYDSRAARSCRNATQRDSGSQVDGLAGNGLNKLGVCHGPNNNTASPSSNCKMNIGNMNAVNTNLASTMCTRSWVMSAGASTYYYSGGNSYSCTS